MRYLTAEQIAQVVREQARPHRVQRPIGYRPGVGDYDETETFQAEKGPPLLPPPPVAQNQNSFALYPFTIANTSGQAGSVSILPQNLRRTLLLIQNQSDPLGTNATMYVNFAGAAQAHQGIALYAGWGVVFDLVCPSDAVAVFFDTATAQPGIIIEGSPRL
jgi:hypothetical protein